MEPFLKQLNILRFSLFIFFFVVASTASQVVFQNISLFGDVQVASAVLASPDADPLVRANALLAFLDDLQKEIDAINLAQQQAGEQGQILILDPDNPSSVALRFNTSDEAGLLFGNQKKDKVLLIRNKTNQSVGFSSFEGLNNTFYFKGGAFPGAGGTCGTVIKSGDCKMVFTFEPANGTGKPFANSLMYRTPANAPAQLVYQVGGNTLKSNALVFAGYGVEPASVFIDTEGLSAPILPNKEVEISIKLVSSVAEDLQLIDSMRFGEVRTPPLAKPFSIKENTCAVSVPLRSCAITLLYSPDSVGVHEATLAISYNDGAKNQKKEVTVKGEALSEGGFVDQALVIYNESNLESVELKNYYLANRPGFKDANVLGVNYILKTGCDTDSICLSGEVMYKYWYKETIADPITKWMQINKNKKINTIILMRGIPNRFINATVDEDGMKGSLQHDINKRFGVLVTSLDMGSVEATKRYIDKLNSTYSRMSQPSIIISAVGGGKSGTTYYSEDAKSRFAEPSSPAWQSTTRSAKLIKDEVVSKNPTANVVYRSPSENHLSNIHDVLGFMTWGENSDLGGEYMFNGSMQFSGNSSWYLIHTFESYNGQWVHGVTRPDEHFQGNFIKFFSRKAFGGTNYENTPVAAVTHVEEPHLTKTNDPTLFSCWDSGIPFIYCAWSSRATPYFQAVGDPWVAK
ncbi:MAG: hypothetical protein NUV54_01690 [Candidatus Taylorbacteria bacterium]|nr:hypothetical protein [Candidatus Taylorbacteria bacterium]